MNQTITPVRTCIILAGGFGTRLQTVVSDLPKVLAPVAGKPFLTYVFNYLLQNNITHVVLAVGYKSEAVQAFAADWQNKLTITISHETSPLGTGGAIKKACEFVQDELVLVINGDTFFPISLKELAIQHQSKSPNDLSIALKPLTNFDRYGVVETNADHQITAFKEKQYTASGAINGGTYLIRKAIFNEYLFPEKFSFEKDFLETHLHLLHFHGFGFSDYFIDIGIPEDYQLANEMLPRFS